MTVLLLFVSLFPGGPAVQIDICGVDGLWPYSISQFQKLELNIWPRVGAISDIKLTRTDTILGREVTTTVPQSQEQKYNRSTTEVQQKYNTV